LISADCEPDGPFCGHTENPLRAGSEKAWQINAGLYRYQAIEGLNHEAAIYVRVSTDKQTVENQVQALRQIAERRGWQVAEQYSDAGISGVTA
jgi:predicted site-specific integrase-resolvase